MNQEVENMINSDNASGFKNRLTEVQDLLREKSKACSDKVALKTREAADATDFFVKENPWRSLGIAAGVGLLVGGLVALSSRRK